MTKIAALVVRESQKNRWVEGADLEAYIDGEGKARVATQMCGISEETLARPDAREHIKKLFEIN